MKGWKVVLFLLAIAVLVSGYGCAAPLVAVASSALTKGAVNAVGTGVYNAVQNNKDKLRSEEPVPEFLLYNAGTEAVKNAALEVLSESGDTIDTASNNLIKTVKRKKTEGFGILSSFTGRSEISLVKTVTLARDKGLTRVAIKVDTFRKTSDTAESRRESEEYEQKMRGEFFEQLSKKIKPLTANK